jgi:glycine cleavage system regulatory protein
MPSLVLTLVGPDRPGLVGSVSDVVRRHDGNWLESRMSHLAGQFAGIVLIDIAEDRSESLLQDLQKLSDHGLKVVTQLDSSSTDGFSEGSLWTIAVVGNDRSGIVREVTSVLAAHDVNVEELVTECTEAPQAGGKIFKAHARLRLPEGLDAELLQEELERLATDLMIDLQPGDHSFTGF